MGKPNDSMTKPPASSVTLPPGFRVLSQQQNPRSITGTALDENATTNAGVVFFKCFKNQAAFEREASELPRAASVTRVDRLGVRPVHLWAEYSNNLTII